MKQLHDRARMCLGFMLLTIFLLAIMTAGCSLPIALAHDNNIRQKDLHREREQQHRRDYWEEQRRQERIEERRLDRQKVREENARGRTNMK
jgi:cytochrome c biogenesis protein ResB